MRIFQLCLGIVLVLLLVAGPQQSRASSEAEGGEKSCDNPEAVEEKADSKTSDSEETSNSESSSSSSKKVRMITPEELATKTGRDGEEIWLSVMGEVYDVTTGKQHYGPKAGGYSVFAGSDSSVAFVTGKFTPEEGAKSMDTLTLKELPGVVSWRDFYKDHKTYKFVGRLIDPRYYDEEGNHTPQMIETIDRIKTAFEFKKEEAERKKKERAQKAAAQKAGAQKTGFQKNKNTGFSKNKNGFSKNKI